MTGITKTWRTTEIKEIKIERREEEIKNERVIMTISNAEYVIDRILKSIVSIDLLIDVRMKVRVKMNRVEGRGDHEESF